VAFFQISTVALTMFDQYKIEQLEIWLTPDTTVTNLSRTMIASAIDLDDAATPTSFLTVSDKQGSLVTSGQAGHYHKWKPHMATAVYSGAFTSFANEPAGWIDSGSPNVQHYGVKSATSGADGVVVRYSLEVRGVLSFRSPSVP
jgi:hypothetical protein